MAIDKRFRRTGSKIVCTVTNQTVVDDIPKGAKSEGWSDYLRWWDSENPAPKPAPKQKDDSQQ